MFNLTTSAGTVAPGLGKPFWHIGDIFPPTTYPMIPWKNPFDGVAPEPIQPIIRTYWTTTGLPKKEENMEEKKLGELKAFANWLIGYMQALEVSKDLSPELAAVKKRLAETVNSFEQ